jgi:hypothetical protein
MRGYPAPRWHAFAGEPANSQDLGEQSTQVDFVPS